MKTSMGLLATTVTAILAERDINDEVVKAFDKFDRLHNASAKQITCKIIDEGPDWWEIGVSFDWKKRDAEYDETKPSPGDLEVIVKWKRKNNKTSFTVEKVIVSDSAD